MQASPSSPAPATATLARLTRRMLRDRRLIMASNRGPVTFTAQPDGQLVAERGSGGVVTALLGVARVAEVTWIAATMGDGDREASQRAGGDRLPAPTGDAGLFVRFVDLPPALYHRYYNVFCNPLLWFIQHYMWNTPRTPNISRTVYEAWERGYLPANRAFAETIAAEAAADAQPPYVILHDYHLYGAVGEVRARLPGAVIQHFTHIPWPEPRYWELLPHTMRRPIYASLCAADIIGLQTLRDVRNFLNCCETFLDRAEVDYRRGVVLHRGQVTRVRAYPISIDAPDLAAFARSDTVRRYDTELEPLIRGKQVIVRVDRSEPSKNILRGFRAFELLIRRYPELRGRVVFLAFIVPSRTDIGVYQSYADEVFELVEAINEEYGAGEWTPISLFYENDFAQAIAAMRHYDALLVNPLIDGMNLVAKEGALVNERDGMLLLSETAGAFEELQGHVLPIAPADIEGTVRSLYQALTMPRAERAAHNAALKAQIGEFDLSYWLRRQLQDLSRVANARRPRAPRPRTPLLAAGD